MEVACSLDEFAKVLAANGYINDDSCFADADIPSMLSVLESAGDLGSPDSFPDSDEDIARVLEMTQMTSPLTSPDLMDTGVRDNPQATSNILSASLQLPLKPHDPCVTNAAFNNSVKNTSESLALHNGEMSSNSGCTANNCLNNALPARLLEVKDNDLTNNNYFDVSDLFPVEGMKPTLAPLPLQTSTFISSESIVSGSPGPKMAFGLQGQIPSHVASSSESMSISDVNTEQELSEPQTVSTSKQKRKRKSKGYSRPAKSRKNKNKSKTEKTSPTNTNNNNNNKKLNGDSDKNNNTISDKNNANVEPTEPQNKTKKQKMSSADNTNKQDIHNNIPSHKSSDLPNQTGVDSASSGDAAEAPKLPEDSSSGSSQGDTRTLRRSSRSTRNTENYNFRLTSLVKRVETERRQVEPKQPKGKIKPPPLSKYRRRTANARERDRMKEINDGFELLKNSLPNMEPREDGKHKMTKFSILKLALNYISALREMLGLEPRVEPSDDDASWDSSSAHAGSVSSSNPEDSCSSPSSGQSELESPTCEHPPSLISSGFQNGNQVAEVFKRVAPGCSNTGDLSSSNLSTQGQCSNSSGPVKGSMNAKNNNNNNNNNNYYQISISSAIISSHATPAMFPEPMCVDL